MNRPVATSYLTDALRIADLRGWLAQFHAAQLELHSSTHPPGPVLFYYGAVKLFGEAHVTIVAPLVLAAIATLGLPVMWCFAGLWTEQFAARLLACTLYALLPALTVFFPEFDHPVFAMLITWAWLRALEGSPRHALLLAAALFGATLFAWNLLAVGVFVVLHAAYFLWRERARAEALAVLARTALLAVAGLAALYLALWAISGYDPVASLMHAIEAQRRHALPDRPWLTCVVFDLYDFLFGAGRMALVRTWLGLATIVLVDLSGLLRAETARVWLFLQPFVLVPAALALSDFNQRGRLVVLALQWAILVAMVSQITFIAP